LSVLRTGATWRDLPERFGSWSTAWSRFRSRLKQYRRVATRYEKRARHYLAMLTAPAALLWL